MQWTDYFRYPAIRAPVTFIYAEDDVVAPYAFIEEQLARLCIDGIDATGVRFPATPPLVAADLPANARAAHVSHLVRHPDEYAAAMDALLAKLPFDCTFRDDRQQSPVASSGRVGAGNAEEGLFVGADGALAAWGDAGAVPEQWRLAEYHGAHGELNGRVGALRDVRYVS